MYRRSSFSIRSILLKVQAGRNVSTTFIQPGLEFRLWRSALVQWLYGLVTRLPSGEGPGRSRVGRWSCLSSAWRYVTGRSGAAPCGGERQAVETVDTRDAVMTEERHGATGGA